MGIKKGSFVTHNDVVSFFKKNNITPKPGAVRKKDLDNKECCIVPVLLKMAGSLKEELENPYQALNEIYGESAHHSFKGFDHYFYSSFGRMIYMRDFLEGSWWGRFGFNVAKDLLRKDENVRYL